MKRATQVIVIFLCRNLTSLTRKGVIDKAGTTETFGLLDKLTIGYSGNHRSWVNPSTEALPFEGMTGVGLNGVGIPCTYDASGRLNCDDLRGIESIEYDNDGHPVRIVFTSGNEQRDVWDGLGNHLATEYYTPHSMDGKEPFITKSYGGDGQVEYRLGPDIGSSINKVLQYTQFPGGYFDQNSAPHYYVTDYQGNITGTVNSVPEIEEETNYYPYGEPWREIKDNPFTFSGNERLLNDGLNEYDFNARRYIASIPAFSSWDALNEQYPWLSPYAYCAGNPIRMIDPSGNRIVVWDNGAEWELRYENEEYNFFNVSNNSTEYWNNTFMIEIIKGVDELVKGDVGKLLIDGLIQSEETITIQALEEGEQRGSSFNFNNGVLKWDYKDMKGGPSFTPPTWDRERPVFIGLGHELSHAYDYIHNITPKLSLIWYTKMNDNIVTTYDIFAGNMENCLRYEHSLPLRFSYGTTSDNITPDIKGMYYFSSTQYTSMLLYLKLMPK